MEASTGTYSSRGAGRSEETGREQAGAGLPASLSGVGPYPHMWLSDDRAPYIEQIGLGLGTLKVAGTRKMSIPIWPAFLAVPREKDPIRAVWQPHGMSPVEPETEPEEDLELLERSWRPHCLRSQLRWRGVVATQRHVALQGGAMADIEFERPVKDFLLRGESFAAADVREIQAGLEARELSPGAQPARYAIRFDPPPSEIAIEEGPSQPDGDRDESTGKRFWTFVWRGPLPRLRISLEAFGQGEARPDPLLRQPSRFSEALAQQTRSWDRHYAHETVRVESPDRRINQLVDYLAWVYRSNGLHLGGLLTHRFNMPKQTFSAFWCWDCCFNAIGGRWLHDRELVWGNLKNMPSVQYPKTVDSAGCIANSANADGVDVWTSPDPMAKRLNVMPGELAGLPKPIGDGSHPPVLAQALHAVWESEGRRDLPPELLQCAIDYNRWWDRARASERFPGLLLVRRWSDSGMDNSKRWGGQGSGIYGTELKETRWQMPIITVDVNTYSTLEKRALANMLEAAGNAEEAARYRAEAKQREGLVHEHLWNQDAGFYFDRTEADGSFVPVYAPTGAYPLLLEGLRREREESLIGHLLDPELFFTQAPFPTLAVSDPDFRPSKSYWMGPTWMCYTIYLLRGMFRRQPDKAWLALDRVLDTLIQKGVPYIFENYNPLTRQYQDCQAFLWHTMLIDLLLIDVLGVRIKPDGLRIERPRVPAHWREFSIRNAYFAGKGVDLAAQRGPEGWRQI